jgi:hypothetical protein
MAEPLDVFHVTVAGIGLAYDVRSGIVATPPPVTVPHDDAIPINGAADASVIVPVSDVVAFAAKLAPCGLEIVSVNVLS